MMYNLGTFGPRAVIRYWLWQIGLTDMLPREYINRIAIMDCGEPLERVESSRRLIVRLVSHGLPYVRRGVLERLRDAAARLPGEYRLILVEGYRSLDRQRQMWERELKSVRADNPGIVEKEIERLTRLRIANPSGQGGGHQTGGAVDVTLANADGEEVGMGTKVQEFSTLTPTRARGVGRDEAMNRRILGDAMKEAGFSNFPGEWWHFSYGDRLWAAYSAKPQAIYGLISSPPAGKQGDIGDI